jgi:DNA-binding NtrC family response regulator
MAATTTLTSSTQSAGLHESPTILVVDDDGVILKLCTEVLKNAGYHVFSAKDGFTAIEICLAERSSLDLALLDINMPKMSGLKLLDCLASSSIAARFILMSGDGEDAFANPGSDRHCSFLPKPFTPRALVETVRRELETRATEERDATEKPETTLRVA